MCRGKHPSCMHECNKESAKVPVRTDVQVPVELACRQRGRKYLLLLPATSGSVGHTACHREAKGYAHQSSQHSGFRPSLHECLATHRLLSCEAQSLNLHQLFCPPPTCTQKSRGAAAVGGPIQMQHMQICATCASSRADRAATKAPASYR